MKTKCPASLNTAVCTASPASFGRETVCYTVARAKKISAPRLNDGFWRCFTASCNVLKAARAARIARVTHYRWLDEDPTYPVRFKDAMRIGIRTLEDEAVRRAHEGVKKLVLYKGKPIRVNGELVYETEYDSQLLMFLLKACDRKRFGDKPDTTLGPNWSGNLEDLPEELLKQIAEVINAQTAAMKAKQLEQAQTIDVSMANYKNGFNRVFDALIPLPECASSSSS